MAPSPQTPPAEIEVDTDLVHQLIRRQHPDLVHLPVAFEASGWDNITFRLGGDLAVRLPRREIGARLIGSEQVWLPILADRLPLQTPAPLRLGVPGARYPWRWSIVPWIEGRTADLDQPDSSQGLVLADFFRALHQPAPPEAPRNPFRGVALSTRQEMFHTQLDFLKTRTDLMDDRALAIWDAGVAAPQDLSGLWIHGDPHPRNVLVAAGRLKAFIDWGDMAQGDPASDLAAIWMLLDSPLARQQAMEAYGASDATWARARGWAMYYVAVLLATGLTDDPAMKVIAVRTLNRLLG